MNYKHSYNIVFLVFLLSSCSLFSTPPADTLNKQIALVELGYIQALRTVKEYQSIGLVTPDDQKHIDNFIDSMSSSLDAVYLAKGLGDISTAEGQLKIAITALDSLKQYLIAEEKAK